MVPCFIAGNGTGIDAIKLKLKQMKLSKLLVLYATETAQTKVSKQTAEQFLKQLEIENKVLIKKSFKS